MADSMSSRCPAAVMPSARNESMVLNNQSHQTLEHSESDLVEHSNLNSSPAYHDLSAMPAVPTKQCLSFVNTIRSLPSSSHQSSRVYQSLNDYTQSPDRPTSISSNCGNQNFSSLVVRAGEIREDIRQEYVYTYAAIQHDLNMCSQSPSPFSQLHPQAHVNSLQHDSDSMIPFSHNLR